MNGMLAQMIAITAYGNAYLHHRGIPDNFDFLNTTFQFCNKVDFRELRKMRLSSKTKESVLANNPTEWFKYLKGNDCKQLRLHYESSKNQDFAKDYKLAGFVGGGGIWIIEAVFEQHVSFWVNRWEVTNQNAADEKIWTVNYTKLHKQQRIDKVYVEKQSMKDALNRTLKEISDFARKQNLQYWEAQFEKAKSALDSPSPEEHFYHKDLIPLSEHSLMERQLLFSAGVAWVFGGMGSWNDLGFENQEDNDVYEYLSEQLYSNINNAIIAAINT